MLVTGHTGFKGSWLSAWLLGLGAQVGGLSIDEPTIPSHFGVIGLKQKLEHFECDIRSKESIQEVFDNFQPEIVFHLAAQAIVRKSFDSPDLTIETNAIGTMNVLESVRKSSSVKAVVVITSDKCYSNAEWVWGYRETDMLGGADPYSASKACAENISGAYIQCFFSNGFPLVATARAGNVIGGGDWAQSRIIPDCARSWAPIDLIELISFS